MNDPSPKVERLPYAWPEQGPRAKQQFRVGVIRDSTKDIQPAVRENFEKSVEVLVKFCDITPAVPFPELPFGPTVTAVINAEGANSFRDLIESARLNDLRTGQMKTNAVALPYHIWSDLNVRYECNAGKCLPGDRAPFLIPRERFSVTGLLGQSGTMIGLGFLFP